MDPFKVGLFSKGEKHVSLIIRMGFTLASMDLDAKVKEPLLQIFGSLMPPTSLLVLSPKVELARTRIYFNAHAKFPTATTRLTWQPTL